MSLNSLSFLDKGSKVPSISRSSQTRNKEDETDMLSTATDGMEKLGTLEPFPGQGLPDIVYPNDVAGDRRACVYGLADPLDMRVRYVGATKNLTTRLLAHCCIFSSGRWGLFPKSAWLKELRTAGRVPVAFVLEELHGDEPRLLRLAIEGSWINRYNEQGLADLNVAMSVLVQNHDPLMKAKFRRLRDQRIREAKYAREKEGVA